LEEGGQPPLLLLQAKKIAERKIHSSGLILTLFFHIYRTRSHISHLHTHSLPLSYTHTHTLYGVRCCNARNHRWLFDFLTTGCSTFDSRTYRTESNNEVKFVATFFSNGALSVQIPFYCLARLEVPTLTDSCCRSTNNQARARDGCAGEI